ncbi:hypothetical protein [Streptomyces adustus]|uniref:hypothetical protein n=1 Tax=Streptomyces adustus TaxID=1609272 RepID=UPI00371FA0BE
MDQTTATREIPATLTGEQNEVRQRAGESPAGFSLYYTAGATYIVNGLEDQALRTDDVPATLRACADCLAEVMPEAFRNLNMDEALIPPLQPLMAERLRFLAAVHELRLGAKDAYASVLDEILAAVRKGAEIVPLCDQVLDVLNRVKADRVDAPA